MLKLKELREQLGFTQAEMAKRLEISPQTYNNYESGRREPDYGTLIRFANFFGVTVDYLIGNENLAKPDGLTADELLIINRLRNLDQRALTDVKRYLDFKEYEKEDEASGG